VGRIGKRREKIFSEMEQFQQDLLESVKQMKRGEVSRLTDVVV